ncbi:hypothetical protein KL905_003688 [Ogataea polymorpha]|uniref:Uncharacterized protein n=1 Tax=Ogataea polymorpha TaxID=460523 RepID=A0A1B7SAI8_9ASCO|nr:uncharacterized protein OGAPODRAFT_17327 [Ogataea polymorpha]KAG7891979.1 hypothetical protein KL908_003584 [Ogataea polymorpha]KAG7919823.1 hypothetical protein KL905_003688 [Ogataea polymorpha]KAG7932729.1 hypothetical protein KL934_003384 [Ogataea polymorpha]KAH3659920.1 hypothetical protein OGATHE_005965 [Ogataea polymorpha]OBA13493.1 hypothetical protein OGAPODRAFT_17327 [Ogataea polymorpha]
MPPRKANRRKGKNILGKGKSNSLPAGTVVTGLPSETLQAVLLELNLSYDSSLGLLQGDSMFSTPSEAKLTALKKLLEKLIGELESGVETDKRLIASIDSEISQLDRQDNQNTAAVKEETSERLVSPGVEIKQENDDDDEDSAIQMPKRKRQRIIITANGERREITPDSRDEGADATSEQPPVPSEDDEDALPVGSVTVKKERPILKITQKKPDEEDKLEDGEVIPSVYIGKEKPDFKIDELLESARNQLELYDEQKAHEKYGDGEEFLKYKYAVADFPHDDLKDLLPGEIPMTDFSTAKPNNNQIAFTSFQAYVEPFFRPFTEEDIRLLRTKCNLSSNLPRDYDDQKTPYHIPRLGPHYADVWYEEDLRNGLIKNPDGMGFSLRKQLEMNMLSLVEPKASSDSLSSDVLETEEVSCGPLTSRLLSALIKDTPDKDTGDDSLAGSPAADENGGDSGAADTLSSSALADQQGWKSSIIKTDYKTLEERLKRELRYIGVYMNVEQTLNEPGFEQDWVQNREDDEISTELRHLQKELKAVQARNIKRKKKIIPIVEEQIAWQEYMSILEDLDKQVEQHYRRRINVAPKKAKKRGPNAGGNAAKEKDELANQQLVSNSSFMSLLEKRNKWISRIGPLFKSQKEMRRMPSESVFKDVNMVENEEEEEGEEIAEDDVLDQMDLE